MTRESVKAPWDRKTVRMLNERQENSEFHPYTCPNRSNEVHRNFAIALKHHDTGILIATPGGWICGACGYYQDWY